MPPEVIGFRTPSSRRGFTLIEIMVVIGIIVVLAAISVAVGVQAKAYSAKKYTATTLTTLNNLMREYLAPENGGNPEPGVSAPIPPAVATTPASDAVNWVRVLSAFPKTADALNHLTSGSDSSGNKTMLDGFGTPIVYVPSNSAPGILQGYFWSAGADRLFGTPDDVHSTDAP